MKAKETGSNNISLSQSVVVPMAMDEVLAHYACTFENSNLHIHFQR